MLYPGKYFEVREQDAPTKYVWNGDIRVAQAIGVLGNTSLVQRLRICPGWQLVSFAVTGSLAATGTEAQDRAVQAIHAWDSAAKEWQLVAPSAQVSAGMVLWLIATSSATLTISGPYSPPTNRGVAAAGDFCAAAGLEAWELDATLARLPDATAGAYDAPLSRWFSWLPGPLDGSSDLPSVLAPGHAIFIRTDASTPLELPAAELRLRYFHPDHLGSTVIVTDAAGQVAAENSWYPFGNARNQQRSAGWSYGFAQKEQDSETRLSYFEARYLFSVFGRFLGVDPIDTRFAAIRPKTLIRSLSQPQRLNAYAYAINNPFRYRDSNGMEPSTPSPIEFDTDRRTGGFSGNINGTRIAILPDNRGQTPRGHSAFTKPSYRIVDYQWNHERDVITRFTPPQVVVTIQTTYRRGVNPNSNSGYGIGTELGAADRSLRRHEGGHGTFAIQYLRNHALPAFEGRTGMTVAEFRGAFARFQSALESYFAEMHRQNTLAIDCVGSRAPFCPPLSDNPDNSSEPSDDLDDL